VSEPTKYQIDRSRIIFEQFEDETVLVNTETGYYYTWIMHTINARALARVG